MIQRFVVDGPTSGHAAPEAMREVDLWRARRRVAPLPCGQVAYVDKGAGPAALFVHGFPLSGFQWRYAIERLADVRRCLAPDLLGLGDTEITPDQSVAPTNQAQMLAAFLDYLGVDQVDLVANDSGNAIAQLFAVENPRRVRTLLLTNGDSEPNCPPAALEPLLRLASQGRLADEVFAGWAAEPATARGPSAFGGLCYSDPETLNDAAVGVYLGPLVANPARKSLLNAYAAALAPNALAGIADKLRKLHAPTRVLWGEADGIFNTRMAAYLADLFPRSRGFRYIPGGKLFWPEELPEVLETELRTLWASDAEIGS